MKNACNQIAEKLLTIDQATNEIEQAIAPVNAQEQLILHQAVGRILAHPVFSLIDIPADRIAAMDGYAFSGHDIVPGKAFSLRTVGTSWAGKPFQDKIQSGQCVRIFTGAVMPENSDSVIMQEFVHEIDGLVQFPSQTSGFEYVRQAGSDVKKNTQILAAPKQISAVDCALLASAGIFEVTVKRKIRIAFFSTGDELTSLGQPLDPGQIYDSNRFALKGLLNNPCFSVTDLGVIRDDREQLKQTLLAASRHHDVIITTGGASVGEADYLHEVLEDCGQVNFWKVAMKPGKPLIFGSIDHCLLFGLPGNPVSVVILFQKIILPALQQLSGITKTRSISLRAVCRSTVKKKPGRQEYQRGILVQLDDGRFEVDLAGQQDSHQLSTLSKANCFIVLAADNEGVTAGEWVNVEPFTCQIA